MESPGVCCYSSASKPKTVMSLELQIYSTLAAAKGVERKQWVNQSPVHAWKLCDQLNLSREAQGVGKK